MHAFKPSVFLPLFFLLGLWSVCAASPAGSRTGENRITIRIAPGLENWQFRGNPHRNHWQAGHATLNPATPKKLGVTPVSSVPHLVNSRKGETDIYTTQQFSDCKLTLEAMLPEKSNSGIYLMGLYEIQLKDSFRKTLFINSKDMGAVCGISKPRTNAAAAPGTWQRIEIDFQAPRFKNGQRIRPAVFKRVTLNGQIVQENVLMEKGPTSGALNRHESQKGPVMLQGRMGAVAFRNIRIFSRDPFLEEK